MRILTICFCLFILFGQAGGYAADAASSGEPAKVEIVKAVPIIKGAKKLLGSSGDYMFFSTAGGSVAMTDLDGKLLHTLQAKDGGDPVLKKPEALALGAGTIYVADSELNQVARFSTDGKYLGSFGAKRGGFFSSGGGEHELNKPRGVAYYEGIVYVLDSESKRILMFGSNGVYLSPLDIRPGAAKVAKGQEEAYKLREPADLKVDGAGRLYVLDAEDSLVKVYSSDGMYLHAIPWDGELIGLAVAQDGIYVAKNNEYTIQKYDFNDKLMYRFGGKGDEPGQLMSLSGMSISKDRQILLADTDKGVVKFFVAEAGMPMEVIPKSAMRVFVQSDGEIPIFVNKLAWNGKDTIYGVDADQEAVDVVRNDKLEKQIKFADVTPIAVAVDAEGSLWILDKKKYRVIKLDAEGKIIFSFGSEGTGEGQFDSPTDLVISPAGKIYVSDKRRNWVQIFDKDGKLLSAVRKLGDSVSIAVDAQENLYVLDNATKNISMYSVQGGLVGNLVKEKEGTPGNLLKPVAIMATFDEIFVLDGNRVKVYSRKGDYIRAFGAKGARSGELNEPVAIAQKDDMSFFVAERSNKRIQTFVTQYRPPAPEHLAAKNGLHSIELDWDATPIPYVKQYRIYRSKDEHIGFVQAGTSSTNQFIDRGLEANGVYFYRVAAQTRSGYEGATSSLVNGTSQSYKPAVLAAVDVVATSWQIKMTWKPLESEYVNSYIIYQKTGETVAKVGETVTPEFTINMLTPDTKYTYYVAAHSSDGVEAEKFEVNAATLPFSQAPLEIEVLNLRPIFSNSYKIYEQDGVGTVKLTNNTDKTMGSVTLSFLLKDFMDFSTELKIEKLAPGKSVEVKLVAVFNNNILNVTEDTSVQASLEASYFENGKRQSYSKNAPVSIYEKHKLLWSEPARYASFITPKDPPVMTFVRSVVTQYPDTKDESQLAAIVFNALGVYGLTYVQNPNDPYQVKSGTTNMVDYVQFPRETLERKSGDCVDLVGLYVASLESLGIETRVIEVPDHLLMMFSTGVKAEADGYNMDDMYVVYNDMLWIPVETTVVGSSFVKAWETGAANYYKWQGKGLDILDTSQAWQTYKPASLPDSQWKPDELSKESIDKKFPAEFKSMQKMSADIKTRRYRQKLEKDPADVDAHLQMGIILAKMGDRSEAMKYFDKVLSLQPGNAAALNNRGNLFMIDDKYAEAQKAYREAAKASPNDPYILVNLAKTHKALNEIKEAKEAFAKAQRLDSGIKKKYKALALELSNTL